MNPVLFEMEGVLTDSQYLLGEYSFTKPVQINKALLTCRPPSRGTLGLVLEVDGVETPVVFIVLASAQAEVTQSRDLSLVVPANATLRWKAHFDGAPENAASKASITLSPIEFRVGAQPALTVTWVNGLERLTLFNYAPATHGFTEAAPGLSAGRASITNTGPDNSLTIAIQDTTALVVADGKVIAGELRVDGVATQESPRLEFVIGGRRVATLTKSGVLRVLDITEVAAIEALSVSLLSSQFAFFSNGAATAVLSPAGVTALNIAEPLPAP
jgi:hypothetical protein